MEPFKLVVPQSALDDLHDRLDRTRWPSELPEVGWSYGVPLAYLQDLAGYWRHSYSWRAAESTLNKWPQFVTEIDGTRIHFAHIRSASPSAIPLLMIHGWPGSIVEFTRIAPLLHDFHLVFPSLPGFTLSGPTVQPGWEIRRITAAFATLMTELGYSRYGVQGGDWGSAIARELGRTSPSVIGVHLNLLPNAYQATEPSPSDDPRTWESWRRFQSWTRSQQGYADIQSTRPQTLAYALTDSPVGQLAWIAEKFHEWSDTEVDRDLLLTNVMLYWLTATAGSSARLYYERAHASYWGQPPLPSTTPTAIAHFPKENFLLLPHIAAQTNNITQWTDFDRGGHFAALEQPGLLAADIHRFFYPS